MEEMSREEYLEAERRGTPVEVASGRRPRVVRETTVYTLVTGNGRSRSGDIHNTGLVRVASDLSNRVMQVATAEDSVIRQTA